MFSDVLLEVFCFFTTLVLGESDAINRARLKPVTVMGNIYFRRPMNKIDFDRTMNSIAIDSMVLICFMMVGLICIGTKMNSGDVNSGSMLGVIYMPFLLPFVPICLGLIRIGERFLKSGRQWLAAFAPIVCMVGSLGLKSFDIYILAGGISIISFYCLLKPIAKKIVL